MQVSDFSKLSNVETYIGTKIIKATSMSKGDYNKFKGWSIPNEEDPTDKGYIIKYDDSYVSWSPFKQFDEAYQQNNNLDFGLAINVMKKGEFVARLGWNGVNIFIGICNPTPESEMTEPFIYIDTTGLKTDNPHAPKNKVPWLASQTDMLKSDWYIV